MHTKDKKNKKEIKKEFKKEEKKDKKEVEDFEGKYLRALADYQNLLKRSSSEKQEFAKFANKNLIIDILPVYDNLKVALKHIDDESKANGWVTGIKYVVKQFKELLESNGVEEIKTIGKKFDHSTMEALKGKGDKVINELKSGYKLNGRVIVAAKVELED